MIPIKIIFSPEFKKIVQERYKKGIIEEPFLYEDFYFLGILSSNYLFYKKNKEDKKKKIITLDFFGFKKNDDIDDDIIIDIE